MPNTGPVFFSLLNVTGYNAGATIFNASNLPARGGAEDSANDGSNNLRPRNLPTTIRIQASFSASGVLSLQRISSAGTTTETVNGGVAFSANTGMGPFDVMVDAGESINFTYSASGTINKFSVREVGMGQA